MYLKSETHLFPEPDITKHECSLKFDFRAYIMQWEIKFRGQQDWKLWFEILNSKIDDF